MENNKNKEQIDQLLNKYDEPEKRIEDLDKRIEFALDILNLISEYELKIYDRDNSIFASFFDFVSAYSIKILSLEVRNDIKPVVIVSCSLVSDARLKYEYKKNVNPDAQSYADLFKWITDRKESVNINSSKNIKVSLSANYSQEPIANPNSKLRDYIRSNLGKNAEETDYSKYYVEKNNKIETVYPIEIIRDSVNQNYEFEKKLRQYIIALGKNKDDKCLTDFIKSKKNNDDEVLDKDIRDYSEDECKPIEDLSEDENESMSESSLDNKPNSKALDYCNWLTNECIKYNEKKEKAEKDLSNSEKEILKYVEEILIENGHENPEVHIDERGVIRYRASDIYVDGYAGQVFLPDNGSKLIKTKYRIEDTNFYFVPEYKAFVKKKTADNPSSLEERTVLLGYEQILRKVLYVRITTDLLLYRGPDEEKGNATSINRMYRKLYEARFDYNFLDEDNCPETKNKLNIEDRRAIVNTLSRKVRYSSYFFENNETINHLVFNSENGKRQDNEYFNDDENIYLIKKNGYFDPEATSSGKEQGSTRYLVEGATVNVNGTIKPSEDIEDRTPAFKHGFLSEYSKFNPFDRNQMVFSNYMRAYNITDSVGTALITCGGWNMEDGFVVSKEFADKYTVPDANGKLRSLRAGDKILDRGGNKGIISIVVDRNIDVNSNPEYKRIEKLINIFNENKNLDVIASPYSGLSRFNGATARELMKNAEELKIDGKSYGKCIGKARYIITRQFADKKTKIYSNKDYMRGNSRKASAQFSWALCSKDAKELLRYFYKDNERSRIDLEEVVDLVSIFDYMLGKKEGKPFPAILPNDHDIKQKKKIIEDDFLYKEEGLVVSMRFDDEDPLAICILPMRCRPGYRTSSGRFVENEITRMYREILVSYPRSVAKKKYESLKRCFSYQLCGDNNIVKTKLMTRSVRNSATAIWTPDPTLNIESIAISETIASELDVKEEQYLLIWRDPVLRDSNVRYMKVERIDSCLTGIAINPVMAKCFDGDFDGDTVAVVKISNSDKPAKNEAYEKFSVINNLLDEGRANKPLCLNTKQDIVSAKKASELDGILKKYKKDGNSEVALKSINKTIKAAFDISPSAVIHLGSKKEVTDSLKEIHKSRAKKGSITNYNRYFSGKANSEDIEKVQKATAIKSAVGIAGRYSQQLMRAFREICPKAVLELTYPNTQALLQIKHEPSKAVKVYNLLAKDLMDAWNMNKKDRFKKIIELYGKNNLNQPIDNEEGIDERYLVEINNALGDNDLKHCRGYLLDEYAYNTKLYLSEKRRKEIFDYFRNGLNTDYLKNDKGFILEAVTKNSEVLGQIKSFKDDKEIMLAAVAKNGHALKYCDQLVLLSTKNIQEVINEAVSNYGYAINYVSGDLKEKLKDFESIIKTANKGNKDKYLGFNDDEKIVRLAVERNGRSLQYASEKCKKNESIVKKAVESDGLALQFASDECKENENLVKKAVNANGIALKFADSKLKKKKAIALAAVNKNPRALEYVSSDCKDYEKIVLKAVEKNGSALGLVSSKCLNNPVIVLKAVNEDGSALQYVENEKVKNDPQVVFAAVNSDYKALNFVNPDFEDYKVLVMIAVKQDGGALMYATPECKSDPDIVLEAVKTYGLALQYVENDDLKKDPDIVRAAVENDGLALEYVSQKCEGYEEIAMKAVTNNGSALQYVSQDCENYEEIVLKAVTNNGLALQYVEKEELKDNEKIVRTAVENDGLALKYASVKLKFNPDIVTTAVKNNGLALEYEFESIRDDHSIVLEAVKNDGSALQYASKNRQDDRDIVLAAVSNPEDGLMKEISDNPLKYASKNRQDDRVIVFAAVKEDGCALKFASDNLKNDREIVLAAVKNNGLALQFASDNLKNDRSIVLAAVRNDGLALKFAPPRYSSDIQIVRAAVNNNGFALKFAEKRFKNDSVNKPLSDIKNGNKLKNASAKKKDDKEYVLKIVSENGFQLEYASDRLKYDREIVLAAVNNDGLALQFASDNLKNDRSIVLAAITDDSGALKFANSFRYSDCFIYDSGIACQVYNHYRR